MGQLKEKWGGGDKYDSVITLLNTIFIADNKAYKEQRIERIMNNINIPEQAKSNVNEFKNYFKEIDVMNLRGLEILDVIDIQAYITPQQL